MNEGLHVWFGCWHENDLMSLVEGKAQRGSHERHDNSKRLNDVPVKNPATTIVIIEEVDTNSRGIAGESIT